MDGGKTVKVNIFSGFWRLAVVLMAIWSAGCMAYRLFSNLSASANLVVWSFGQPPVLDEATTCTTKDASAFFTRQVDGKSIYGKICFKSHPSDNGEQLVPYASAGGNGRVWMLGPNSDPVRVYIDRVANEFAFTDDQLSDIKASLLKDRLTAVGVSLLVALGGSLMIFCFTKVIGWVARGFVQRQA